jgi:hypothetical protein
MQKRENGDAEANNNYFVNLKLRIPDVNTAAEPILLFLLAFEESTQVLNRYQRRA